MESALAAYPVDRLHVIVVDDGSDDPMDLGLPEHAPVRTVRHDESRGVGRSRNHGYGLALKRLPQRGNGVVAFCDAHMRFPRWPELLEHADERGRGQLEYGLLHESAHAGSSLEILVRKAARERAIVTGASRDVREGRSFWASGADLFWNRRDGLQAKWRLGSFWKDAGPWERVPCMMGAAYFMSLVTAHELASAIPSDRPPGGSLWPDVAGRWGFSEQALSVKGYLMGMPVIASRNVFTRHLYRSENPIPDAAREVWKNVARAGSRLFHPEVFGRRLLPYCRERLSKRRLESLLENGERDIRRPWTAADERRVFTHLCGKHAPVTRRHDDHAWLDRVGETVGNLPHGARVLQWRPGEATLLVARQRPDVRITCITMPGPRANNWRPVVEPLKNVRTVEREPKPSCVREPLGQGHNRFDLILVGGAFQRECIGVAENLLRRGGRIITNERADCLQITDEERRKERQRMSRCGDAESDTRKEHRKGGALSADRPRTPRRRHRSSGVTVVLLNWQRPENLPVVLDGLEMQTERPRIWLWDNSPDGAPNAVVRRCDMVVRSSRNLGCFARWWLASQASTAYVCSIDDDLRLTDERVLEDAVKASREKRPDGIVGMFGWDGIDRTDTGGSRAPARSDIDYGQGRHINGAAEDTPVDIIKGRFMLFRRELLGRIPLRPPASVLQGMGENGDELFRRCDDIYLNLMIAHASTQGRTGLVPGVLGEEGERCRNAGPQDNRALATDDGHYRIRGKAIGAIKKYLCSRGNSR